MSQLQTACTKVTGGSTIQAGSNFEEGSRSSEDRNSCIKKIDSKRLWRNFSKPPKKHVKVLNTCYIGEVRLPASRDRQISVNWFQAPRNGLVRGRQGVGCHQHAQAFDRGGALHRKLYKKNLDWGVGGLRVNPGTVRILLQSPALSCLWSWISIKSRRCRAFKRCAEGMSTSCTKSEHVAIHYFFW